MKLIDKLACEYADAQSHFLLDVEDISQAFQAGFEAAFDLIAKESNTGCAHGRVEMWVEDIFKLGDEEVS